MVWRGVLDNVHGKVFVDAHSSGWVEEEGGALRSPLCVHILHVSRRVMFRGGDGGEARYVRKGSAEPRFAFLNVGFPRELVFHGALMVGSGHIE